MNKLNNKILMKNCSKTILNLWPYLLATIIITLAIPYVLFLDGIDLTKYPLMYQFGDASNDLLRSHEMHFDKSFFTFDSIGSPYGSDYYGFYGIDLGLLVIQYLFAIVVPNYILGSNLFLLSSFYIVAYTFIYAAKRLGLKPLLASLLAVTYTFLPYHSLRLSGHTYLCFYFIAPIALCFAIELFTSRFDLKCKSNIAWLIICGMTGIYYSFFACFYFLIAGIVVSICSKSIKKIKDSLISIGLVIAGVVLCVIPVFVHNLFSSEASKVVSRARLGTDIFSFRIAQLILPTVGHRSGRLAELRNTYMQSNGIMFSESDFSTFGIVISIGLLLVLIYSFFIFSGKEITSYKAIWFMSLATLLIATQGSLSTIFTMIFPLIRCYNRISVFLAFLCAIFLGMCLGNLYDYLISKFDSRKTSKLIKTSITTVLSAMMLCVCAFSIWDQSSTNNQYIYAHQSVYFQNNKDTVDRIMEVAMQDNPEDGTVDLYFLPYIQYPETNISVNYFLYEPIHLVVHDNRLQLSYGVLYTNSNATTLQSISTLPLEEQLIWAEEQGYDGILLASRAIDNMEEREEIINELRELFGRDADVINYDYYYYDFE